MQKVRGEPYVKAGIKLFAVQDAAYMHHLQCNCQHARKNNLLLEGCNETQTACQILLGPCGIVGELWEEI